MPYIRDDQAQITVSLNGVPFGNSWATTSGGDLEATDSKTRPGGMGREVSAGGPATRTDLTVTTQFTDIVSTWHPTFEAAIGNGRIRVGVAYLGPDRLPTGRGFTRAGTLKHASVPPSDTHGNAVGMYTVIVSCDELAA